MNYHTQLHQAKMSIGSSKSQTAELIEQFAQEILEITGIEKIKVTKYVNEGAGERFRYWCEGNLK